VDVLLFGQVIVLDDLEGIEPKAVLSEGFNWSMKSAMVCGSG
jgi:hypothetical protein